MGGAYALRAASAPWMSWVGGCRSRSRGVVQEWLRMMAGGRESSTASPPRNRGPFAEPPGPSWAGGGRSWRAPKARRGDVRAAILAVLAERPSNGYQIIQEIAERSGGAWKPSPGSIYPTLQQLEDEGLVRTEDVEGRRVFRLTDEGSSYVTEHADDLAAPWQTFAEAAHDQGGLKPLLGQAAAAGWHILNVGTPDQQARAREALVEFRSRLYSILAENNVEGED
jgi:DNA-binding PadR family transcriptional regulator